MEFQQAPVKLTFQSQCALQIVSLQIVFFIRLFFRRLIVPFLCCLHNILILIFIFTSWLTRLRSVEAVYLSTTRTYTHILLICLVCWQHCLAYSTQQQPKCVQSSNCCVWKRCTHCTQLNTKKTFTIRNTINQSIVFRYKYWHAQRLRER